MKGFFKGVWQFCSYLFWPQWGSKNQRHFVNEDR